MISHQGKFIYLDQCRTGGHSIRHALARNFEVEKTDRFYPGRYAEDSWMRHHTRNNLIQNKSWTSVVDDRLFESYFTFGFVRNPWDKLVSQYHWCRKQMRSETPKDFSEYVTDKLVHNNFESDGEIRYVSQVDFFRNAQGVIDLDFIGRFESLQEDFNRVCISIKLEPIQLPHISRYIRDHYSTFYTSALRGLVADVYSDDIEVFGYTFGDF